jgi:hypothetical protein
MLTSMPAMPVAPETLAALEPPAIGSARQRRVACGTGSPPASSARDG